MVADALAGVIWHHQAEEEKWDLQRKLAESAKLAILGRLASRFAHEIRNPLTAVGGFARRLQKNSLPEEKVHEYATLMVTEAERLENVLRNLITMSQPEIGAISPHNIN
ncbi:MAG: histidine kinase dimerization/phospho-acceptor domain-containing protein, partial [Deltaproteobacteria bacterium]